MEELPPESLCLYFKGKDLIDAHMLFEYKVGLDACIQLMIWQPKPVE